ncbi:MAG: M48 family metalloprotease [Oligoflexia bacterium]|nr:M48 family metalloprotease [Oligoflexia bacterium]
MKNCSSFIFCLSLTVRRRKYQIQYIRDLFYSLLIGFYDFAKYHVDKGGARLAGKSSMIAALERLNRVFEEVENDATPAMQTLKISSRPAGIMRFFSTHPPLEERIARLKETRV